GVEVVAAVDADKGDASAAVGLGQLRQGRGVTGGHRAVERQENDDNGLRVLEIEQPDWPAGRVFQGDVFNLLVQLIDVGRILGPDGGHEARGGDKEQARTYGYEQTHKPLLRWS